MIPFNYHHLFYFYTIAKERSMSRASKVLRVSQPALSSQVKQFENYLGVKLFHREGRRLVLTEEGNYALTYAEAIVNAGRELIDGLKDRSKKGRTRIQIGVSDSIPKTFAARFVDSLFKIDEKIELTIQEDNLAVMLEALKVHALDMILSDVPAKASTEEGLQNFLIARIPVVFCAHPELAGKYRKIPEDLKRAPLILPTSQSQVFHAVQEYLAAHGITPNIVGEIQDIELVYRLVLSGRGIAPLNQWMIENAPRDRLKVLGKNKASGIWDHVYIIIKKRSRPHPLVEKILSRPGFKNT